MLKYTLIAAATLSTFAFAAPHRAQPVKVPPPTSAYAPVGNVYRAGASGDRADVARAQTLLRELDRAVARRDVARVRQLDVQMAAFVRSELNEASGMRRDARVTTRRLQGLERELRMLTNRHDVRAQRDRRDVYAQALRIAQEDLSQGSAGRFARR